MGDTHGPEPGHWGRQLYNLSPGVRNTMAIVLKCQQTIHSSICKLQMPVVMVNNYSISSKINKIVLLAALTTHSGNGENRKHLPPSQPMSSANRSPDVNGFYSLLPLLRLFLKSLFRHHSTPLATKCTIKKNLFYVMYHTHFIFFQGLGQEFGRESNSGSVYLR